MDKTYYVTITGLDYYYGKKPFAVGRVIKLVKEEDNEYDSEAIAAVLPFIDTIGYVANSTKTVYDGTLSAGRLYDKIDEYAFASILFVTHSSAIALVLDKDEVEEENDDASNADLPAEQKTDSSAKKMFIIWYGKTR